MTIEEFDAAGKAYSDAMKRHKNTLTDKEKQDRQKHFDNVRKFHGELGKFISSARHHFPESSRDAVDIFVGTESNWSGMDAKLAAFLSFEQDGPIYHNVRLSEDRGVRKLEVLVAGSRQTRRVRVESSARLGKDPEVHVTTEMHSLPLQTAESLLAMSRFDLELGNKVTGPAFKMAIADQLLRYALSAATRQLQKETPVSDQPVAVS